MSLYSAPKSRMNLKATPYLESSSMISSLSSGMEAMNIETFHPNSTAEFEALECSKWQHLYILPVLLLEFLALALTRAVLPSLLLKRFGTNVYLVMGCAECIRGFLAFLSCPIFGKLSDHMGRKICLLVTVAGTCAPVCALALLPWEPLPKNFIESNSTTSSSMNVSVATSSNNEGVMWPLFFPTNQQYSLKTGGITVFVVLLAISGIFSSTFTLVFAYISDSVRRKDERVSAYGLAMATLGLSFTIGPLLGGYLAKYNTHHVFVFSLILTLMDLFYIHTFLPESKTRFPDSAKSNDPSTFPSNERLKFSWNPFHTIQLVWVDPFLRMVGIVAFLYYTALWAVVSTLVIYAAKRFALGPERLGELMSALGLSTMISEAVLVRIVVPILGEKQSMRIGLAAFAIQCILLGFSFQGWHLFVCIFFSMIGNLVYPSLSSLVSGSVEPCSVGEALGALNGIKALTEGIGPLIFGSLLTLSEDSALPGWPYALAGVLVYAAFEYASKIPDTDDEEYVHEVQLQKRQRQEATKLLDQFACKQSKQHGRFNDDEYQECISLLDTDFNTLSEIDEDE
jgi:MFS transporter, DHA1 family, tetracycline resistance protein